MRTCSACVLVAAALLLAGCRRDEHKAVNPDVKPSEVRAKKFTPPKVRFTDVTAKAGIAFTHVNGAFGKKLMPETLGGGCAFLDFDNDGHQDLLLVNSCYWPGFEDAKNPAPTMKLYRNKGDGTFDDVTKAAGLDVSFYGMGAAVGDFDNDGFPDLFITGVGGNRLFKNVADGKGRKFVDVTRSAGDLVQSANWPVVKGDKLLDLLDPVSFPSSAAFLDFDKDGLLDLFVCNYVSWSPKYDLQQGFTLTGLGRAYGPPKSFEGTHCQLYRNRGDGTFENVSRKAGIEVTGEFAKPVAKALGVVVCDVDEDGWPDIFVANDTVRNFFFHNQRNGAFEEKGGFCGVAYAEGTARGAMGIDFAEYRPGECGLLIGNFANEPNTFLKLTNPKETLFADVALTEGIAGPSRLPLVFGLFFFDYDLDGRVDFLSCNGHLEPEIGKVQPGQAYKQAAQLYWNTGEIPGFELVGADFAGPDLFQPLVGRGCAYADIDGNGTLDVLLAENGGSPRLFKNEGGTGNHWVRFVLEGDGKTCNRSAIGARVVLTTGKHVQKREVSACKGYLSSSELPVTFGLGKADKIDRVEIHWPARNTPPTVLTDVPIDRVHRVAMKAGG